MIFSDKDIQNLLSEEKIRILPFDVSNLRSGSYSLSMGDTIYKLKDVSILDVREMKQEYDEFPVGEKGYVLAPGEFIVTKTKERIVLAEDIAAILSARGSRAQIGLHILLGSVFLEPGTDNHIALEMQNISKIPIQIFSGIPMVKVLFVPLSSMADRKGRGRDFFRRQNLE